MANVIETVASAIVCEVTVVPSATSVTLDTIAQKATILLLFAKAISLQPVLKDTTMPSTFTFFMEVIVVLARDV